VYSIQEYSVIDCLMAKEADMGKLALYGRRLRNARVAAERSQADVAAAIGCRQPFVSKAEAGEMMLRPYDYAVVAQLLGVEIDALIGLLTEQELAEAERVLADAAAANREWRSAAPREER
jgi:transcriptional regulator with XRE-family HTH domain